MKTDELDRCFAAFYFRRRANRLLSSLASQMADIDYPCPKRLLLWRPITLFNHVFRFSCPLLPDNHPGGFLLFYWMLFIGDKWILDSVQDALEVTSGPLQFNLSG